MAHTRIGHWSRRGSGARQGAQVGSVSAGSGTTATRLSPPGTGITPKKGPLLHPPFQQKTNTRPQNGGRSADPKMGSSPWPVSRFFRSTARLRLHRRRRQDLLRRQAAEAQVPPFSKALQPFLGGGAAGRAPGGCASLRTAALIYGEGAPLFPYELRWRRDALRAVLLSNPMQQTHIFE